MAQCEVWDAVLPSLMLSQSKQEAKKNNHHRDTEITEEKQNSLFLREPKGFWFSVPLCLCGEITLSLSKHEA